MHLIVNLFILAAAVAATSASVINRQVFGASPYAEQIPNGGRSEKDDKRYSIEQLNRAARHRNVYYDRAGSDPYGIGSPMMSRRGKRSVGLQQQYPAGSDFHANPNHMFIKKQMNINEKRNYIARLNYAARHRNVNYDNFGSDPYGGGGPIVSRSFIKVPHRHGRSAEEETNTKTIRIKF